MNRAFINKTGFTLVEVMISAVVLTIVVLGVSSFYINQVRQEKKLRSTLEIKTILDSTISLVSSAPESHPTVTPLQPATIGNPFAMYVFCMTTAGMVVQNQFTGLNSTAVVMQATDINVRAINADASDVCTTTTAQVEVHMAFSEAYLANLVAIELPIAAGQTATKIIGTATVLLNAQLGMPVRAY